MAHMVLVWVTVCGCRALRRGVFAARRKRFGFGAKLHLSRSLGWGCGRKNCRTPTPQPLGFS